MSRTNERSSLSSSRRSHRPPLRAPLPRGDAGTGRRVGGKALLARKKGREPGLLSETRTSLLSWLGGQLVSMTVIGVLSTAALYIIGVPGALFLVIFTGLVCFVPLIGPVVSAVPPLVLDFAGNPIDALWVLLAYIAIQQVESNLLIWHSTSSPEDGLTLPPLAASLTLPLFGKRPSASRSAWPTGTSRGPKAGRSSWRPTTGSSRTTTPSPTSPTSAAKTVVVPRGRPELGCGDAIPPKGPRARLLLRAPHADAGRLRLRDPDALETLRRGRPRRQGGGSLAAGEDAHRGARRREPLSAYEI